MIELVIAAHDLETLSTALTADDAEEACAVLLTAAAASGKGGVRLLVRTIQLAARGDYARQGELEAELTPDFVARITKQARTEGSGLVFVHSHPGDNAPDFSPIDDFGEKRLAGFLSHRHPSRTHAALVLSRGGMNARILGTDERVRVIALGKYRRVAFEPHPVNAQAGVALFDRQVRAFGASGQGVIQSVRVGIVGLGGTGSLIAQQLAHLGVRDFLLIDPDVIEESNLNRVVHATRADIGRSKVIVAAEYIRSVAPESRVEVVEGDVIRSRVARSLGNVDVIFGCTDSHGSRAVLQQVAYQYLVPCIDTGAIITSAAGHVTNVYGRVQLLSPGFACFTCSNLLNPNEVRRDMMTAFERNADPYLQGEREPAPAVISINGTVTSLAVTMFLAFVTGFASESRHLLYNALASGLRTVRAAPADNCFICSRLGAFARGDAWPLNARND